MNTQLLAHRQNLAFLAITFATLCSIPQASCLADDAETGQIDPRSPKVITNPHPTKKPDKESTRIHDATPSTPASVTESPLPKLIEKPDPSAPSASRIEKRKTLALALGGGGVRGAAHIGVLRVLEREGIPIDYIVGNSMGAIVGGLYSSGLDLDKMQYMSEHGIFKKNYAPMAIPKVIALPIAKMIPKFGRKSYAGIVSGKKFEAALAKMIPAGQDDFAKTKIPFSAVATNLIDGKAYRISEGKLSTAIRASSSISPILKPVQIGDKVFVDGAVRANLPASSARETGADVVLAVLVDEPLKPLPEKALCSYKGVAQRLADIVLAVTDENQLQFANIVLNPDVSGIPILGDRPENVRKAIRAGEIAAEKALPEIRKQLNMPSNSKLVDTSVPIH